MAWTEEEHRRFLEGLKVLGKGNWRGISRQFVASRSPTQVASHAQKYFLRLQGTTKRRSRFTALEQGGHRVKGGSPEDSTSPSSSAAGGGSAVNHINIAAALDAETSSKPFTISSLPACLLSAPGHPMAAQFLFPPFNPMMFGLPSLSSSPSNGSNFPMFLPHGSPPMNLPWMMSSLPELPLSVEAKSCSMETDDEPLLDIDLEPNAPLMAGGRYGGRGSMPSLVIKPAVGHSSSQGFGLSSLLRCLSVSSISSLAENAQETKPLARLHVSALSAFKPLS